MGCTTFNLIHLEQHDEDWKISTLNIGDSAFAGYLRENGEFSHLGISIISQYRHNAPGSITYENGRFDLDPSMVIEQKILT